MNPLLIKRLYRQNAVEPFSEKELKRLYEAFVETRLIASLQPQRIKKSYEDFIKVSDEILKLNETVRVEFVKIMENWEPNPMAKLPPFDQFRFESNTAYFRAVSRDNLRQYQSEGVEKVQIVAYIDDRTSPTCLDMHGRVFTISDYADTGQALPNPDEMLGIAGRPTTELATILPPYHFNCRTTFVTYEEPKNELDKVKEDIYNCEKISNDKAQSMLNKAVKANWGSQKNLKNHYFKHGKNKQISLE
ncbi:MAG: phage minor head protein, partial [Candidatus Cloacimonetes bacterium]|nr:phage minor head protein [Candidatus Cloacimonadota bacterium]